MECEAWGLLHYRQCIFVFVITNVIFELNCKSILDDVLNVKHNKSQRDFIIFIDIVELFYLILTFYFIFTTQQTNKSAYASTKVSISCGPCRDFRYPLGYICIFNK